AASLSKRTSDVYCPAPRISRSSSMRSCDSPILIMGSALLLDVADGSLGLHAALAPIEGIGAVAAPVALDRGGGKARPAVVPIAQVIAVPGRLRGEGWQLQLFPDAFGADHEF